MHAEAAAAQRPGKTGVRIVGALLAAALAATVSLGEGLASAEETSAKARDPVVVNLNLASVDELMELPGIGPAKAEAIAAFRKARGAFKRVEDLMKVKGIGRKTFLKLKPFLSLKGPALGRSGGAAGDSPKRE